MNKKNIIIILIILLTISCITNLKLYAKNHDIKTLTTSIYRTNFSSFPLYDMELISGDDFDIEIYANSIIRMEKAAIAGDILSTFYDNETTSEYDENFAELIRSLEYTYKYDKDKLVTTFNCPESKILVTKIGENINDLESIKKLIELLDLDENYYN